VSTCTCCTIPLTEYEVEVCNHCWGLALGARLFAERHRTASEAPGTMGGVEETVNGKGA